MSKKKSNKPTNASNNSLIAATRGRASFSGHRGALGASGYRVAANNPDNCEFLNDPGHNIAINCGEKGFEDIFIGVEWDNTQVQNAGFFSKILKKATNTGVDLDIGCLYEMQDGTRGAIQAFGEKFGAYDKAPFISLSGDERTGDADGHDEYLTVNGQRWDKIKRLLVYIYIYEGAARWSAIKPQVILDVPGENDLVVTLGAHNDALCLCAVGELENIRGGIRLTNRTEYFPGHMEMDRAFGYGLDWADGKKD